MAPKKNEAAASFLELLRREWGGVAGVVGGSRTYPISHNTYLNNIAYLHAQTGLKYRPRPPGRSHGKSAR
jgi:hypothetical protein